MYHPTSLWSHFSSFGGGMSRNICCLFKTFEQHTLFWRLLGRCYCVKFEMQTCMGPFDLRLFWVVVSYLMLNNMFDNILYLLVSYDQSVEASIILELHWSIRQCSVGVSSNPFKRHQRLCIYSKFRWSCCVFAKKTDHICSVTLIEDLWVLGSSGPFSGCLCEFQ